MRTVQCTITQFAPKHGPQTTSAQISPEITATAIARMNESRPARRMATSNQVIMSPPPTLPVFDHDAGVAVLANAANPALKVLLRGHLGEDRKRRAVQLGP